jgi:RimJ/RimL family protein N-acetyltransferase
MEHVGMRREGTLRQRLYNKSRFVDVQLYAILRDEWRRLPGNGI